MQQKQTAWMIHNCCTRVRDCTACWCCFALSLERQELRRLAGWLAGWRVQVGHAREAALNTGTDRTSVP